MLLKLPMVNPNDYQKYEDVDFSLLYSSYLHITGSKLDGKQYDFLIKMIPDTNWVISVYAPMEIRNTLKKQQRISKYVIIAVIVLLIFVLSLIEIHVLEILQKRQMIATIYDPLTGLYTRQHFESEATKWLKRFPSSTFMIIDVDIRGFKFINQKYGEKEADELLVFFSRVLREEADYFKGIIGRGNADHFILMMKVSSVEYAMEEFLKQLPILNEKFKNSQYSFFPSFGISFHVGKKSGKNTIQNLIGQALFAKNSNKNNLITNYAVYDSKLVEKVKEEIFYEENMEQALENGEFFVMYQPKVNLENDKIVGAEALVRWNSPKLGLVGPDKFIPVFEKNGFITKLDFFVYEQVFKFQQECIAQNMPIVPISLNMSRNHSKPEVFMKDFMTLFNKFNIPPKLIEIEILERSVMDNMDLCQMVQLLHNEGFTVAMDDFGSGESSLNMLAKIPVDVLKFDKEFLTGSNSTGKFLDEETKNFIETLVNLGRNLKKQTVFEGVETENQRDFLKAIKCDLVQGFFYSRPLFSGEFLNFIQEKNI